MEVFRIVLVKPGSNPKVKTFFFKVDFFFFFEFETIKLDIRFKSTFNLTLFLFRNNNRFRFASFHSDSHCNFHNKFTCSAKYIELSSEFGINEYKFFNNLIL